MRANSVSPIPLDICTNVGRVYFNFVKSNKDRLVVKSLGFSHESLVRVVEYLFYLDLLLKILSLNRPSTFEGRVLFNIHGQKSLNAPSNLQFTRALNEGYLFGENTLVSNHRFYPVFNASQLTSKNSSELNHAFQLFRFVASRQSILHPVYIDLTKTITLWVGRNLKNYRTALLTRWMSTVSIENDDDLSASLDALLDVDVTRVIALRYPYHSNVDTRIMREFEGRAKRFELTLRRRFYYQEIQDDDYILTPDEFIGNPKSSLDDLMQAFEIIDTDHSKEISGLIKDLKSDWSLNVHNPYAVPFPAKWFMCVNQKEGIDFWKNQYKLDFPSVRGEMLAKVMQIIEETYAIDWTQHLATDLQTTAVIVKSSLYEEVIDSFQRCIAEHFPRVILVEQSDTLRLPETDTIILDPFNIVFLANVPIRPKPHRTKIVAPDFLYYNHRPYLKYSVAKYRFDPLISQSRKSLDIEFESHVDFWNIEKKKILESLRNQHFKYQSKWDVSDLQAENIDLELKDDEAEFLEEEIIDLASERESMSRTDESTELVISTSQGKTFILRPHAKTLYREGQFVVSGIASSLRAQMLFLPLTEISKGIETEKLIERMSSIPATARDWRAALANRTQQQPRLFRVLANQGLSISEKTFNSDWINGHSDPNGEFHLPRSFHDWEIVCKCLKILAPGEAWTAHRSRRNLSALKRAYLDVITYLNSENKFGFSDDMEALESVAKIFEKYLTVSEDSRERISIARSILKEITNHLELQEIVSIKSQF